MCYNSPPGKDVLTLLKSTFVLMQIHSSCSLKPYNTFGIDLPAAQLVRLMDEEELVPIGDLAQGTAPRVLGGGSNILLTHELKDLIVKNELKGINLLEENEQHTWLEVKAGEVWHDFVMYAIAQNLGGIENLALIPGCVGAAPIQNIGAYGVEVRHTIDEVIAWHWEEQRYLSFKNEDCRFGYRDSIFKREMKDRLIITSVVFRLDKVHCLNTSYGAVKQQLEIMGVSEASVKSVAEAVMAIRRSKLPDPKTLGNAGSFFKNPTITRQQFDSLCAHHPDLPSYPASEGQVKIPAGWLIENCGWKGYREGAVGVHEKQALVLVNYGGAKGADLYQLSEKILRSVLEKFDITLEREVNIW